MGRKIAIVHHESATVDMLSELLEDDGFQPLPCSDSRAAYSMIIESQPDLILLDLELDSPFPQWNLVDQLRADAHTQHIPIIALTTSSPPVERPESCQHNCEVRTEPFDLEEFMATVESLIDESPPVS